MAAPENIQARRRLEAVLRDVHPPGKQRTG
jgi:hypothetical protein